MKLIFTRHGETEWNHAHRMQGQHQSDLTALGRAQAAYFADRLRDTHLDGAFVSPLIRARDTAQIILAGRDITPIIDARLPEMSLGAMEGLTFDEARLKYPREMEDFRLHPQRYAPPGGETNAQLRKRVSLFLQDVSRLDGTYLVVTHALVLRATRVIMLNLPPEGSMRVKTPSCCYCEADFSDGAWHLTHFGEPIAPETDGLL